ncbi:MAG: hypothetical protein HY813_02330 [Candidatus Portnoybacteria bacterium]|nr:hypothetical protein [Candidatus Portnoybacteria bacterium]
MAKLHAKSPCCQGEMLRYGNRRRQCKVCKKTWRIRQKKKGRKAKRESDLLARRYLDHQIPTLSSLAKIRKTTPRVIQSRLKRSREYFQKHTPWPELPEGDSLILVADAKVKYIEKKWRTFYLMLVKRPQDDFAVIAPPYHRPGMETADGWYKAIETLPPSVRPSIKAVVCDGHGGPAKLCQVARLAHSALPFPFNSQSSRPKIKMENRPA